MPEHDAFTGPLHDRILIEAKRIEEDALYSSRGHFEAARYWSQVHFWIGIPTAVLAAIASGWAFNDQKLAAGITAALVAVLSGVSTFLNPNERMHAHHGAGAQYSGLRNQARLFREIAVHNITQDDAIERVQSLSKQRDELNDTCPAIPRGAFARARKNIEAGEASYNADQMR